jgi:hypothetical protein
MMDNKQNFNPEMVENGWEKNITHLTTVKGTTDRR